MPPPNRWTATGSVFGAPCGAQKPRPSVFAGFGMIIRVLFSALYAVFPGMGAAALAAVEAGKWRSPSGPPIKL